MRFLSRQNAVPNTERMKISLHFLNVIVKNTRCITIIWRALLHFTAALGRIPIQTFRSHQIYTTLWLIPSIDFVKTITSLREWSDFSTLNNRGILLIPGRLCEHDPSLRTSYLFFWKSFETFFNMHRIHGLNRLLIDRKSTYRVNSKCFPIIGRHLTVTEL